MKKNLIKILPVALIGGTMFAKADAVADATALVTSADTVFALVVAFSLGWIGFNLVMRIVKGIKK